MGDIVRFTGGTVLDEPAVEVLEKAKGWGLDCVVILGANEKGDLVFGGSTGDAHLINWLLDAAKRQLFETAKAG